MENGQNNKDMKSASLELYSLYINKCETPSDIHELLPILRKYAERCDHITEMGVRYVVSTYALMMGMPQRLISYDIVSIEKFGVSIQELKYLAAENDIDYDFIVADTLNLEIDETDFLFIDTWHVYPQLKKELELHAGKVRKYIAFHDTETFEYNGEDEGYVGLWPAIEEFLNENKDWVISERFAHCNGLTVLKKRDLVTH